MALSPEDPLLLGAAGYVAFWLVTQRRDLMRHRLALCFLALICANAIALAAHPSWRGVQAVARLVEVGAFAAALSRVLSSRWRAATLTVLAVAAVGQAGLASAQVARRSVLGLTGIGEYPPLLPFGSAVAGKGSFTHPYLLAGFAVIASLALLLAPGSHLRAGWAVLAAAAAIPLGITYSRMSVMAVLLAAVVASIPVSRWRRPTPTIMLPVLVGAGLPGILTSGGWVSRASQAADAGTVDALSSGRVTFVREAMHMLGENLWFGVGPGQYMTALAHYYQPPATVDFPVHNVPLMLATEGGLLVAAATAAFAITLTVWALGSGRWTCAALVCYLPFLMLDTPVSLPQGIPAIGLWLGIVVHLGMRERGGGVNATAPCGPLARPTRDLQGYG